MWFMAQIVSWLGHVRDYFLDAYNEVKTWIFPFYYLATPLYWLYYAFFYITYYSGEFNTWLDWAADRIDAILSWDYIKSLIKGWLPKLEDAVTWFKSWWSNVTSVITSWWASVQLTVQDWIATATQGLSDLLVAWNNFWTVTWPNWLSSFNSLKAAWDNFWKVTFPTLVSFSWLGIWWNNRLLDIQSLIDNGFLARDSLWAGWQDWKDKVTEFFTDPFDWIKVHIFEVIVSDFNKGFDRGLKGE